jgi:hypothetical protein
MSICISEGKRKLTRTLVIVISATTEVPSMHTPVGANQGLVRKIPDDVLHELSRNLLRNLIGNFPSSVPIVPSLIHVISPARNNGCVDRDERGGGEGKSGFDGEVHIESSG